MDLFIRTAVLSLGWFATVNALGSVVSGALAFSIGRLDATTTRPRLSLAIRLFPSALSLVFVIVMFLPSQWALEPREGTEILGLAWYVLAAIGGMLLLRSALHASAIARVSRSIRSERPGAKGMANVEEVDNLPGISLAGVLRPRILIGPRVTAQLSRGELEVAIAHEIAHRDAFDNLARWCMLCAPDFLKGSAAGRRLERVWHGAAESRADARAINGDRNRAVHLASALLKVARLSAGWTRNLPAPSWSTLNDSDLLEWRVHRLLYGALPTAEPVTRRKARTGLFVISLLAAVPLLVEPVHRVTEALVAVLP